jgi:four helix bundle protein
MRDYRNIQAWKFADDLAVAVYAATKAYPRAELYGLTSQLRRAVTSVPANIVEGAARNSQKDYLHFLQIARGSLAETHYLLHLSQRLGYLGRAEHMALAQQAESAARVLAGLIRAVESEVQSPKSKV